jgi:putative ATPase
LEEIVGQEHLLGEGKVLRRYLQTGKPRNFIIYGPPGVGKTTYLNLLEKKIKISEVYHVSASTTPITEIKKIVNRSIQMCKYGKKIYILLDEIHNLRRNDQRVFLEPLEKGCLVLVATTTEPPSKYVIPPLLSRMRVYTFRKLTEEELVKVMKMKFREREVDDDTLRAIAVAADGDARKALTTLEEVLEGGDVERKEIFTLKEHYDLISALIKSIRGSDPDASVYYLARLLRLGEDPRFIARRLVILASEDIGLADPNALPIAVATAQAVEMVGMPEAEINLAHAVIYLSLSPKSNSSYMALKRAKKVAENPVEVPKHLKNIPESGYKYPHDYGGWIEQRYLPDGIDGPFYIPNDRDMKSWREK